MSFFLPKGYSPRTGHEQYLDVPGDLIYQPDVYDLGTFLAERCGVKWIVDVGCGSGEKLKGIASRFKVIGIDSSAGIALAKDNIPQAELIECNLENGLPMLSKELLRQSVVICSDVIEHLQRPDQLMGALAGVAKISPFVLISTPDRDRVRGWLDDGPPDNPAHVMEWAPSEFLRFMRASGFEDMPLHGHTINTDFHRAKTTLLAVAGTHAVCGSRYADISVAAIIHTYNEADILPEVVEYLVSQGVAVHVFDNWSTDGSWDIICQLRRLGKVTHAERFPERSSDNYQWQIQLEKTAEYAATLDAQWVMHHDADEIRVSPWKEVTLRDALAKVDQLGYNAIDFTVIDFRFIHNRPEPKPPFQTALTHFEFGRRPGHFSQVKCWKNEGKVLLSKSGGHHAVFDGRRIYPLKFLLKHYPLRSREQAEKKIFKDRLPRFKLEQQLHGWHTQYEHFKQSKAIEGWTTHSLIPWHATNFMTEFLVERISGIGLMPTGAQVGGSANGS